MTIPIKTGLPVICPLSATATLQWPALKPLFQKEKWEGALLPQSRGQKWFKGADYVGFLWSSLLYKRTSERAGGRTKFQFLLVEEHESDALPGVVQGHHPDRDSVPGVDVPAVHLADVDQAVLAHPDVHEGSKVGAVLHCARQLLAHADRVHLSATKESG